MTQRAKLLSAEEAGGLMQGVTRHNVLVALVVGLRDARQLDQGKWEQAKAFEQARTLPLSI